MNIRTRGLTYAGVVAIVAGFGVITFVWGRVAALTAVPLQLPYLVSGGLTALGLIMVGVLLVNIQTKFADAARRDRQIQQLAEVMDQIRSALTGDEPPATTVVADDPTDEVPVVRAEPELQHS
jgi:Flp pilus assembly protein TadB